ncbi:MAG TPA: LysM domain-containing protein [Acidimicrobiales bacterium]|nr:LysM domain-containing protein [Acidimicrobiales bacterium]
MTAVALDWTFKTQAPRRLAPAVYRRRRIVTMLLVAGLVLALATVAARLGREPHIASEPTSPRVQLVSREVHVVAPGDTLWTIARSVQPTGDLRPLVQQLAGARHGAPLQVGERIVIPAREVVAARQ